LRALDIGPERKIGKEQLGTGANDPVITLRLCLHVFAVRIAGHIGVGHQGGKELRCLRHLRNERIDAGWRRGLLLLRCSALCMWLLLLRTGSWIGGHYVREQSFEVEMRDVCFTGEVEVFGTKVVKWLVKAGGVQLSVFDKQDVWCKGKVNELAVV
jgi:hypothetical protein